MIDVAGMAAPDLDRYWNGNDWTELASAVAYVLDRAWGIEAAD